MEYRSPPQGAPSDDPIGELVDMLRAADTPSDAWIRQWSAGGRRDPVTAAWEASWSFPSMMNLLGILVRFPKPPTFWQRLFGLVPYTAESLRQRLGAPPSLAEAVEAARRQRASREAAKDTLYGAAS